MGPLLATLAASPSSPALGPRLDPAKPRRFLPLAGAILVSAFGGFLLRGAFNPSLTAAAPSLSALHHESLTATDSFSEAEAVKQILVDLGTARIRAFRVRLGFDAPPANAWVPSEGDVDAVLADIDRAIAEFAGTDQAYRFHVLKWTVLRRTGRDADWLESYLLLLRQHPLNPMVGDYAGRAIAIGTQLGCPGRVTEALRLTLDIPIHPHQRDGVVRALAAAPSTVPDPIPAGVQRR